MDALGQLAGTALPSSAFEVTIQGPVYVLVGVTTKVEVGVGILVGVLVAVVDGFITVNGASESSVTEPTPVS